MFTRCESCRFGVVRRHGAHEVEFAHGEHEAPRGIGATVKACFKPQPNGGDSANELTRAEVMFAYYNAEHDLPATIGDDFTYLARSMFPDSGIAKRFMCKRTKTTHLMKRSLVAVSTAKVVDRGRLC